MSVSEMRSSLLVGMTSVATSFALMSEASIIADDAGEAERSRPAPMTVSVRLIDGSRSTGTLSSLDEQSIGVVSSQGDEITWPVSQVMWIEREDGERGESESPPLVLLTNDDVLCGDVTAVEEDQLTLSLSGADPPTSLSIPMEFVRSIVFREPPDPINRMRIQRLWALLKTNKDRLISTDYTHVDGELVGLSEQNVQLKTSLATISTPLEQLFAVILNNELSSQPEVEGPYVITTLLNGSRVTWDSAELTESGEFSGTTVWGESSTFPPEQLVQMQFLGDRVIAVAELTPSEYVFTPYLTEQHPLIRNRNVRGGPLRMRGILSATGLGMHSKSAVSFDLTGDSYQLFRADIGVDDITEGGGNVVFSIEVDGASVYRSSALTGKSPVERVESINLVGAKSLKLIVDFGEFANISDVADWGNALLVRSKD